jgi:hypothetical protein
MYTAIAIILWSERVQRKTTMMRSLAAIEEKIRLSSSPSPFIVAIVCGLLFKAGSIVLDGGFGIGFVLVAAGVWILANYFFEIIDHRAVGNRQWPVLSIETLFSMQRQLGVIFAGIIVACVLIRMGLDALHFPGLGRFFGLAAMLVMPVSAAILAVTRDPLRAIDPIKLLIAAARMEIGYIMILVASFAVWLLAGRAALGGNLLLLLLTSYAYLLLGLVIGAVVYTRRRVLGVRTKRAPEDLAATELATMIRERKAALSHAYGFAARGNVTGALAHISVYASSEPDPLAAEVWMFQEMTLWEDPYAALMLGRELPERLTAAGRRHEASKVAAMRDYIAERVMQDSDGDSNAP